MCKKKCVKKNGQEILVATVAKTVLNKKSYYEMQIGTQEREVQKLTN